MNDLISRQEAIDAADRADYTGLAVEDVKKVTDEVVKELKQLPSAQPERKTGHWIFCDESCKCSICGEDPMIFVETTGFNSALMDREYPMRFCPNCGAKMEDENETQKRC